MRITLDEAAIGHGLGAEVPPLSVTVAEGAPTAIAVEGAERPLLVSVLLGGRTKNSSGRVLIDGREDPDELRRRTALVDTPWVAEPTAGIALATIVSEEFAFASLPTTGRAVKSFLAGLGLADYAGLPIRSLPAAQRTRMFCELAALRAGVEGLIVTSPERHGGLPEEWYGPLVEIAERGISVAIVTDAATAAILIGLGARDGYAPLPEPTELSITES